MAGIFGGNQVDFLQHANRPKSYIFKVADGCGNDIERAGHYRELCLGIRKLRIEERGVDWSSLALESHPFLNGSRWLINLAIPAPTAGEF